MNNDYFKKIAAEIANQKEEELNSIIKEVIEMEDWDDTEIEEARRVLKEKLEEAGFTPDRNLLEKAIFIIEDEDEE